MASPIILPRLKRIMPAGPTSAYRSFTILSPKDTLIITACEAAGCDYWTTGWDSVIDERTEQGKDWALVIRGSGRTFRELTTGDGRTVFRFDPYQRCFRDHKTRPERFIRRGGDWRGNPTGEFRQHRRAQDWVEDTGEHLQAMADRQQRG